LTQCIWLTDTASDKVYNTNSDGSIISSFTAPSINPGAVLKYSGDGCVWVCCGGV